jgi:uncharacterized protein involved in response to NO
MPTTTRFPLLGTGFRPFFLLGPLLGFLLVPAWLAMFQGELTHAPSMGALAWHRHEMLFGYTMAIFAGFLLTAVPNWTKTEPVRGWRLGALVILWVLGRVGLLLADPWPRWLPAALDLAFLPALALTLLPPLRRAGKLPNLAFVPVLLAIATCNLVVHLEALEVLEDGGYLATTIALDLIVLVMLIIGGRVIPYFTRRALEVSIDEPALGWKVGHASMVGVILAGALGAPPKLVGGLCLVAAAAAASRLARWQFAEAWRRPILWVLYLGYGWVVVGLLAKAAAALGTGLHPRAAVHLFTVGGIGTLTVGMMARVSLGHTGRPLQVARPVTVAFLAMSGAALGLGSGRRATRLRARPRPLRPGRAGGSRGATPCSPAGR